MEMALPACFAEMLQLLVVGLLIGRVTLSINGIDLVFQWVFLGDWFTSDDLQVHWVISHLMC